MNTVKTCPDCLDTGCDNCNMIGHSTVTENTQTFSVSMERNALWALFRETSPYTGRVTDFELGSHLDYLRDMEYICFEYPQFDHNEKHQADVYQITEKGARAIQSVHGRNIWRKPSFKILDTFTDGI